MDINNGDTDTENIGEVDKDEDEFLQTYLSLGSFDSINLNTKYPHLNIKGKEKQGKLLDYLKVIIKCFYESKYSFAMVQLLYNSGFNKENQSFGFPGYVILGTRQETFIDPVTQMNDELSGEWFMGYYSNMALLRSYASLDMSGGLLNFLFLLFECKPGRPGKYFDKYAEELEKVVTASDVKLKKHRYREIDRFLKETKDAKEIYLKHKKYYNNIKHNYDNYIELNYTARTRPVDLYNIVQELYQTELQYLNSIIKFININVDEIIPSYDHLASTYNPQYEHLEAYARAQNMDESYKKYIIQIR
jgi:hypothetical protein